MHWLNPNIKNGTLCRYFSYFRDLEETNICALTIESSLQINKEDESYILIYMLFKMTNTNLFYSIFEITHIRFFRFSGLIIAHISAMYCRSSCKFFLEKISPLFHILTSSQGERGRTTLCSLGPIQRLGNSSFTYSFTGK